MVFWPHHSNKLRLNLRELGVHEVLERTLQIVGHEISAKGLALRKHFDATSDRLTGDPARYLPTF